VFAPNFVDAYPFFDDNRQFLNLVFSTSPTIAPPSAAQEAGPTAAADAAARPLLHRLYAEEIARNKR
jgi:hypothetical protein